VTSERGREMIYYFLCIGFPVSGRSVSRFLFSEAMASFSIVLAILLWSSLGVVVRLSGVDIHILMFYSLIIAVITQGTIILSQKTYRRALPGVRDLKYPVLLGCISLVNTFTFFYAFRNTTIANAVLTHYTAPIIVAFAAPFLLREKITGRLIFVITLASIGLWVMLDGLSLEAGEVKGIISGIISGFAYALIIIFLRMHSPKFKPLIFVFLQNGIIILLLAPFVWEIPLHALWSYFFMGIIHSTIAPILYFRGLQEVSANRAAVLGYIEPVFAIIFSMLFLAEIPGMNSILGGILIIVSGYITIRDQKS
jgi:drug/metabolite transporter (DMT)-like permease